MATSEMLAAMRELASKAEPGQILMMGDSGAMGRGGSWDDATFEAMLDVLAERDSPEVQEFIDRYAAARDDEHLRTLIQMDMADNYILAGLALAKLKDVPRSWPAIAWAAFNKHTYPGFAAVAKDDEGLVGTEFALVRVLEWAGFDVNAADENGMTALHYFASTKVRPFTNSRAVGWLIKHGADPAAVNGNGDTPLIYLSASVNWTHELTASFLSIFEVPSCDPWAAAKDGKTARMVLEENDPMAPNSERQEIIAQMVSMEMEAEVPDGETGERRPPLSL